MQGRLLYSYQVKMLNHLLTRKHCALFVDMRLGKTIVTVRYVVRTPKMKKILVIGPISAFLSWYDEVLFQQNKIIVPYFGSFLEREKIEEKLFTEKWVFANHHTYLVSPEINTIDFDCIIFDESVVIKSPEKNRVKYNNNYPNITKYYCNSFRNAKKRIILSGYPAPNTEIEYFQQLKFLDIDYVAPFNDYYHFVNSKKMCYRTHGMTFIRTSGKEFLKKKLAKCSLYLSKEDVNFPKQLTEDRVYVEPTKFQKKHLVKLHTKWALRKKLYKNSLEVYSAMKRLASGFLELNEGLKFKPKIEALKEILQNKYKNEKVLILANYIEEVIFLSEFLDCPYIAGKVQHKKRFKIIKNFETSDQKYLVSNCKCIKHGANISFCNNTIFYSLPPDSDTFVQVKDRILSKQNYIVNISYLILNHSYDSQILDGLQKNKNKYDIFKMCIQSHQLNLVEGY